MIAMSEYQPRRWPRGTVETYAYHGAGKKQEAAQQDLRRRKQARRKFVHGLDEDELEEIISLSEWQNLGPYLSQATQFDIEPTREELQSLAQEEIERRQKNRQRQQVHPPRTGGLLSFLRG
jgi:hypothetical protein